jgi:hypothetical protein
MGLGTGIQSVLAGIRALLPAALTTALAEVDADGGPTLSAPADAHVQVRELLASLEGIHGPNRRPSLFLTAGSYDEQHVSGTPRVITRAVLVAEAYIAGGKSPAEADSDARWYGQAMRHALNRIGAPGTVTGLVYLRSAGQMEIAPISAADNAGRAVTVTSDMMIDETRAT